MIMLEGEIEPVVASCIKRKIRRSIDAGANSVTFTIDLPAGKTRLQTWLDETGGHSRGAYFVDVR